jgi:signal transduction histidine kinase
MAGLADVPVAAASTDDRVVVLAPIGRDAFVVVRTLAAAEIGCVTSPTLVDLIDRMREGAGVLLMTEEALSPAGAVELLAALSEQPSWSDVPIVLLLASDEDGARGSTPPISALTLARNVTVFQRPVPAVTIVTAVQASLRARRRQYEVRDLLASERRAREQAETAMRIKDEFLATVSHELRTPVSAILIWSQLLEAGRLSGEQAIRAIHAITTSAETQSRLIEDLLDVSRMLMGKLQLAVEPRALQPIVQGAVDVVRPTADAKGVRLDAQVGGDDLVLVDPDRVQQMFWNLLSNAVKFTPAGGVVSLRFARDRDEVTVTVADTGEGISPEFLPHVFERFRQADPKSSRRQSGLGLGLPIVQQLVELHGGTIEAASPGRGLGATFTVRLPALRRDHNSSGGAPSST